MSYKENEIAKREETESEYVFIPPVDIVENANEYQITASMPGVDKQNVNVSVEDHILILEGKAVQVEPENCRNITREFEVGNYRRSFELSDEVDTSAVKAKVKNGLLKVTLPKREESKPKKIEVNVG